jgi:hypothetical protein
MVGTHVKDGVVWVTVNFEQTTPPPTAAPSRCIL